MHSVCLIVMLISFARLEPEVESEELVEFKKMFHQKRLHQLSAIKQLMTMTPEKQIKLLDQMLTKMASILTESKNSLISASVDMTEGSLPSEQKDKTALALVLENTCLACDVLLRFPNYMQKKLSKDKELDLVYKWALGYINGTVSFVMDEPTKRLFYLAGQELELTAKDADYQNPYKKPKSEPKKIMFADEPEKPRAKKPKKKIQRGPRLSRSEL